MQKVQCQVSKLEEASQVVAKRAELAQGELRSLASLAQESQVATRTMRNELEVLRAAAATVQEQLVAAQQSLVLVTEETEQQVLQERVAPGVWRSFAYVLGLFCLCTRSLLSSCSCTCCSVSSGARGRHAFRFYREHIL